MSTGYGEGENRVTKAIEEALNSPLLNNNDIFNSKKVLLNIHFSSEQESDQLTMEEMNEVHDFMSKFRKDVETKWGLAQDASLGKKVKITVLASGFGLRDIPGMEQISTLRTRMDEEKMAEEEEREELRRARRGTFYKDLDHNHINKRHHNIYIFGSDDLDNDDIISMVETTPTYERSKDVLKKIKNKSASEEETYEATEPSHTGGQPEQTTIKF